LKLDQRVSSGLVGLAGVLILLSPLRIGLLGLAAADLAGVLMLNRRLFRFLRRERGLVFALACVPLHLLYYLYSGLSYGYAWVAFQLSRALLDRGNALAGARAPRRSDDGR